MSTYSYKGLKITQFLQISNYEVNNDFTKQIQNIFSIF